MIARYDLTAVGSGLQGKLDADGQWVRWSDVQSHVDRAILILVRDDPWACLAALKKIIDRENEDEERQ